MTVTQRLLRLAIAYLCFIGLTCRAQQIITSDVETIPPPSVPSDSLFEEEELEKEYPNVVTIKFHLKDGTLTEYLTKLALQETACQINDCNISVIDIVNTLQLSRYQNEVLAEAVLRLNVQPVDFYNVFLVYDVTAGSTEELLQTFGLTFSEIYKNFVSTLSEPSKTIPEILGILGVNILDFMNAQAYGNDSVKLQVLFTGNYSRNNVETVLNQINKTALDLLKTVPLNIAADKLRNFDPIAFNNFVKNLGITATSLDKFYKYLNVSVVNFLVNSRFIKIVTDHYEMLNPQEVLGVIISNNTVITSNKANALKVFQTQNTELIRNYTRFMAERVENQLVQFPIKNVILKVPNYANEKIAIVGINSTFPTNYTQISKQYNSTALSNCTYISKLPFGGIYEENITRADVNGHEITVTKSSETVYNLGSPLYCQGKLYAIATEDSVQTIKFATFLKNTPGITPPTGQDSTLATENATTTNVVTVSEPSSGINLNQNIIYFVVTLVIMQLFY